MYSQLFWEHVRQPHNRRALPDATNIGEGRFPAVETGSRSTSTSPTAALPRQLLKPEPAHPSSPWRP